MGDNSQCFAREENSSPASFLPERVERRLFLFDLALRSRQRPEGAFEVETAFFVAGRPRLHMQRWKPGGVFAPALWPLWFPSDAVIYSGGENRKEASCSVAGEPGKESPVAGAARQEFRAGRGNRSDRGPARYPVGNHRVHRRVSKGGKHFLKH